MSHTPLTHRALIAREKAQLRREELGLDKFIEVTIVIFALLDIAVIMAAYIPRFSLFLGVVSVLAFICLLILIYLLSILHKYKADLKDHMYQVRGTMRKHGRMSHDYRLAVGRQTFRVTPSNPTLWDFFLKHPDGTEISILYSPRTKTVWSITKD